jgi:hypothetical protein
MVNEIKFACPYCSQHIACDAGYRDFTIDCPACGNSMVVPHLQPSDPAHPAMVLVASPPGPARPDPAPIPLQSLRSAQEWAQRSRGLAQAAAEKTAPHWVLSFLAMLIVLFILRIHRSPPWLVISCLIAGTVLTGLLMAKHRKSAEAYSVLRGLGIAAAVCILIPVVALGILFIGCLALQ